MQRKDLTPISKAQKPWIIALLGSLMALGAISVDLYLPVFPEMAKALGANTADMSLTLSSYFGGVTLGQLFYGPMSDRIGRRLPLYSGLILYALSALGCLFSYALWHAVMWRFLMGVGGSVATVITFAIVRDVFEVDEISKVFSLLILVLGFSPLIAPSLGGWMAETVGWKGVFIGCVTYAILMMLLLLLLPESHAEDSSISLYPLPMLREYGSLALNPHFRTYAFSGAVAFSCLYTFIAASPILFFQFFHLTPQYYGFLFSGMALSYVGANQVSILLQKFFSSLQILRFGLCFLGGLTVTFLMLAVGHDLKIVDTTLLLAGIMMSVGLIFPNASSLAVAPFPNHAATASGLMNSTQVFLGMIGSALVSIFSHRTMVPIGMVFTLFGVGSLLIFSVGRLALRATKEPPCRS